MDRCTACLPEEPEMMCRCEETFVCASCGLTRNACEHQPGWPDDPGDLCDACLWRGVDLPNNKKRAAKPKVAARGAGS